MTVIIQLGDLGLDLLADRQLIRDLLHTLAGDLGDVDQAVDARDDLGKGAEGGDGHDLDGNDVADLVHRLDLLPGVVLGLFVDEGNAVVFAVDILDGDFDGIADGNDLGGVLDPQPGQIGKTDAAIHAAQINKRAEIGKALDLAGVDLADLDLFPELLGLLLAGFAGHDADRADGTAALTVGLQDLEADFLAQQGVQVAVAGNAGLAGGDKYLDAIGEDQNAALDDFGDDAGEDFAGFAGVHDLLKAGSGIQTGLGEHGGAFHIVDADDHQLQLVADLDDILRLGAGVAGQLIQRYITGVLGAGVNRNFRRLDACNNGRYLLPIMYTFGVLIEQLPKVHFFSVVFQYAHGI